MPCFYLNPQQDDYNQERKHISEWCRSSVRRKLKDTIEPTEAYVACLSGLNR